jgi:hypothetical protein
VAPISAILGGQRDELCCDVAWDTYKNIPAMNPSTLVEALRGDDISMLHLKHAWDRPRKDTAALSFGRAVHTLFFEPREFGERYVSWTGSRRTKAYSEFVTEAFMAGKQVLTDEEVTGARKSAENLLADREVRKLLEAGGRCEVTLFCTEGTIQCRGRVDYVSKQPRILDLKTARRIQARGFGRDFYQYHYDVKLGLYQRWINKLTGEHHKVDVVCVENMPPYDVAVVPIDDAVLERGARKALNVLNRLGACIESDYWPGIAGGKLYYLDVPANEMWDDDELEDVEDYSDGN